MNHHDELVTIAQERLEESQAELDSEFDKLLGDNNIHSDDWRLDVSPESDKITGTVHVNGEWVALNATLDTSTAIWSVNVAEQKLTVSAADLDYSMTELEEARENLASVEEGADEEDIDHPDGEDTDWDE